MLLPHPRVASLHESGVSMNAGCTSVLHSCKVSGISSCGLSELERRAKKEHTPKSKEGSGGGEGMGQPSSSNSSTTRSIHPFSRTWLYKSNARDLQCKYPPQDLITATLHTYSDPSPTPSLRLHQKPDWCCLTLSLRPAQFPQ